MLKNPQARGGGGRTGGGGYYAIQQLRLHRLTIGHPQLTCSPAGDSSAMASVAAARKRTVGVFAIIKMVIERKTQ